MNPADTGDATAAIDGAHLAEVAFETGQVPNPYGGPGAHESMGSVAAPLLAGFSLTLATLVLQLDDAKLRWRDASLIAMVVAAIAFIMCVQAMFWARLYIASRTDALAWWPDADLVARQRMVHSELRQDRAKYGVWARRAARAYRIGLFALLSGFGLMFVPRDAMTVGRWLVLALIALAVALELAWVTATTVSAWAVGQPSRERWLRVASKIVP